VDVEEAEDALVEPFGRDVVVPLRMVVDLLESFDVVECLFKADVVVAFFVDVLLLFLDDGLGVALLEIAVVDVFSEPVAVGFPFLVLVVGLLDAVFALVFFSDNNGVTTVERRVDAVVVLMLGV
jgi:hypothetical protein